MAKTLEESVGDLLSAMGYAGRQSQRPASFSIGSVLSGTQEGLTIQCGGTVLEASDLWCNEALLEGYSPKLEGDLPGSCPDGSTQTPVRKDQLTRAEFALNAGDRVVLLTEDQQEYYLICKVVPLV